MGLLDPPGLTPTKADKRYLRRLVPSGDTTGATDTAVIQAELDKGSTGAVGVTLAGGDWYVTGSGQTPALTVYGTTRLQGEGVGITRLHLTAGSNSDLIRTSGFNGLTGTGITSQGQRHIEIRDMEIDGNKSNQPLAAPTTVAVASNNQSLPQATIYVASTTGADPAGGIALISGTTGQRVITYTGIGSDGNGPKLTGCAGGGGFNSLQTGNLVYFNTGRGIAIYGPYVQVSNVWVHDCATDGLYTEWGASPGGLDAPTEAVGSMESFYDRCKFQSNGVSGFQNSGPHDAQFSNCVAWRNAWAGFAVKTSAYFDKCHAWGSPQLYGFDIAGGDTRAEGCYAEVAIATGAGVRILGVNAKWLNGWVFGVSGGQGMQLTGTPSNYVISGIFTACNTYAIRYLSVDGGRGVIDVVSQQQYGPLILSHAALGGIAVPSTPTFVDGTVVRTDAAATGNSGSTTITDTAITAGDRGKAVFGTNIPANSFVGAVTVGASFVLNSNSGGTQVPTGAVAGVTLVPAGSDLSDVAATTRIKAIATAAPGFTTTACLSVDNSVQGFKKSGTLLPSATANTYGAAASVSTSTSNVGVTLTDLTLTFAAVATETVTARITAVFHDGTTGTLTKTSTTNQTIRLASQDHYGLQAAGKSVVAWGFDVASTIAASTATVAYFFVGDAP